MSNPLIGRIVRRLRQEQGMTQQKLATRLGISTSYLNLIEHDQRGVTATLLIKLTEILQVDLAALSGSDERQIEQALRETFADPLLGTDPVPDAESQILAASAPAAAQAVHLQRASPMLQWQIYAGSRPISVSPGVTLNAAESLDADTILTLEKPAQILGHWQALRGDAMAARQRGDATRRIFWQERRHAGERLPEFLQRVFDW